LYGITGEELEDVRRTLGGLKGEGFASILSSSMIYGDEDRDRDGYGQSLL